VKPISSRAQWWLVGLGYAAVFVIAAVLLLGRYLQELTHPADVQAYGGMYAGGDAILGLFVVCLFMIPSVFLIWVMAKYEIAFTTYSRVLLGLSLSAPIFLCWFYLDKNHMTESLASLFLLRLVGSPFILIGIGVSRFMARFDRAKRLTSYALLIEGLTLVITIVLLFRGIRG
jgi:hypothetical protein